MMNNCLKNISHELLASGEGETSRHIDEICGEFDYQGKDIEFWSDTFFDTIVKIISNSLKGRRFVTVVPLQQSSELIIKLPSQTDLIFFEIYVPTLYLTYSKDIFAPAFREERANIKNLSNERKICTYRSWNNLDYEPGENLYFNDVYIETCWHEI